MPSSRIALPCQGNTLDGAATLSGFCEALQCFTGHPGYAGYFYKDFLTRGEAIRLSNFKTSTLTLYSLDTLDRGKKTKGYGLVPVQGVQGSAVCLPDTLDSPATPIPATVERTPAMPMKPPVFRPAHMPLPAERRTRQDRARGSASARGYDRDWERLRDAHLTANPLCVVCEAAGRLTAASVVDHVQTIRDRPDLRLDPGNLRSMCKPHHDSRTATEQRGAR